MKRIRLFLALACAILLSLPAKAERVNMEKAEKIARSHARTTPRLKARKDFRLSRTVSKPLQRSRPGLQSAVQSAVQQEEPLYYVFTMNGDGGFIIIAGDDVAKPVLGYSDEGTYDESNPNLAYWMETLAQEIADAIENGVSQDAQTKADWEVLESDNSISPTASGDYVDPLVKTKWNQNAPYNNLCPKISGTFTHTGCVATTMAQIMKYHEYPTTRTVIIPGYTTRTKKISISAIPGMTYDWNNMTNTYVSSATGTTADAVATLMYHCGVSVEMDYDDDGSGAYSSDVAPVLRTYFNYDEGIAYHNRTYYNYTEWINLLKTEIRASRPVYYAGHGTGGHAFVCDGYDADDLFHFNWGWSGSSDGYFEVSALNPKSIGIGGGSGGYNESQAIITGIQPPQQGGYSSAIRLRLSTFSASKSSLNNVTESFNVTAGTLMNTGVTPITSVYLGVLLCNQDGSYRDHKTVERSFPGTGLAPGSTYSSYALLQSAYSLPANLPAGTYKLYPAYSASSGTPSIMPGENENKYITVVVDQNGVTLTSGTEKPELLINALSPVGALYQNKIGSFEAEITNSGAVDYHSRMSIQLGSQTVATSPVVIPAGTTKAVGFSGTITLSPGNYSLSVLYNPNNVPRGAPSKKLGDAVPDIEVKAVPTEPFNLSVVSASFKNGSSAVPQNAPNLTVNIKNDEGLYNDEIIIFIFPNGGGSSLGYFGRLNVLIEKGETKSILFNNPIDFLEVGTQYYGRVYYYTAAGTRVTLGDRFYFTVASPTPPSSSSSDATLKSLVVKDVQTQAPFTLIPAFSSTVTNYTVIASPAINKISIIGEATHKRARFTNIENQTLSDGNNAFNLKITAENGTTEKTYTVTVIRGALPVPGNSGAVTAANIATQGLTLNWTKATDNITAAANLKYYVYQSTSNNISTVADCETNGTLLNANGTADIAAYPVSGLTLNTTYYFNVVVKNETGNKAAYAAVSATTQKATLGGVVTISGNAVFGQTLTAVTSGLTSTPSVALDALSYQWKRGNTAISGATGVNYTLVQADITAIITVAVTAANTQGSVTSGATGAVVKASKTAPATPEPENKTTTSITLKPIANAKYARAATNSAPATSSGNWQDSPAFTGLAPNTTYYFFAYYPETATHAASPVSAGLSVATAKEASLTSLTADGLTPPFDPNVMNYTVTLPCGTNHFTAVATASTGNTMHYSVNNVPATLPLTLSAPGVTTLVIHTTSEDGITSKDYAITITRRFDASIIRTYWDDVLAVNLNTSTNGGYIFTGFQWTKNGQPIANETGPYLYFSSPPPASARYNVLLTTNRQTLPVCSELQITRAEAQPAGLLAYPNPARHTVTLENPHWETATQTDLINLSGNLVRSYPSARIQTLNVSGLPVGLYILRAGAHTVKIVIE
jgi:hypothetical protein